MIVIMKFGGTSLNTSEHRCLAINKIKQQLALNHQVVVVVSAMGRKNEPYSTNTLLEMGRYLNDKQCDRLISQGEVLSSLVFENECLAQGIQAHACTLSETGIITDDEHLCANVTEVNPMWILHYLQEVPVVIVPGFLGLSAQGHVTTLGRGGSDKTAILIAEALDVQHVWIFTDVDGIYDLDPKWHTDAKRYISLSYEECIELVENGACVMMLDSVLLARAKEIEFTVASTFVNSGGTIVKRGV